MTVHPPRPRRASSALRRLALAPLALWAASAHAEAPDVGAIPNGQELGCANCHTNNDRNNLGPFNPWGLQIFELDGNVDWARDCAADGDGDGYTNGQELGDPDCVWQPGMTPAMPRQGHPGDPNIVPGDVPQPEPEPMEPEPDPQPEPDPGEPEPDPPPGPEPEAPADGGPPADAGPQAQGAVISLDDGCAVDPATPAPGLWLLAGLGLFAIRRRR